MTPLPTACVITQLVKSCWGHWRNTTMTHSLDLEKSRTNPVWFPTRFQALFYKGIQTDIVKPRGPWGQVPSVSQPVSHMDKSRTAGYNGHVAPKQLRTQIHVFLIQVLSSFHYSLSGVHSFCCISLFISPVMASIQRIKETGGEVGISEFCCELFQEDEMGVGEVWFETNVQTDSSYYLWN